MIRRSIIKRKLIFIILIMISCTVTLGESFMEKANRIYDNGEWENAKKMYLEASQKGNIDAHFMLAYKYNLPKEEALAHLRIASEAGHEKALDYYLDEIFFRGNSLRNVNPRKAYQVYLFAKDSNPNIELYNEKEMIRTIKMAMEAGEFDVDEFMETYNISENEIKDGNDIKDFYSIWELAEEASRGGRFGEPNPKLVLQLISRGGIVPAELMGAVEDAYENWKIGVVKPFNIRDYITSGMGLSYSRSRN